MNVIGTPDKFAPPSDKYLALLNDTDHYLGGSNGAGRRARGHHVQLALAFLNAYFMSDSSSANNGGQ